MAAFFLSLTFFAVPAAHAQTNVGGVIGTNVTWDAAGSPWFIASNVTVNPGVTLTISSGAVVQFASGTKLVASGGSILANGATFEPSPTGSGSITLQSGAIGDFESVTLTKTPVTNTGSTMLLRNSTAGSTNGGTGVTNGSGNPVLTVESVSFSGLSSGVVITSGLVTVRSSSFHGLAYGVTAAAGTSLDLTDNVFDAMTTAAANVSADTDFTTSGNISPTPGHGYYAIFGSMSANRTWGADLPYVIMSSLNVNAGTTLTLDAGAIVKFFPNNAILYVNGTLHANGTEADPVTFTHITDDDAGGDTNGDLSATTPSSGSWDSVRFLAGSHGTLSHSVVRYGGYFTPYYASIRNTGGDLIIIDGELSDSGTALYQSSGSLDISGTRIHDAGNGLWIDGGTANVQTVDFRALTVKGLDVTGGSVSLTDSSFTNVALAGQIAGSVIFDHSGNMATGGARNGFRVTGVITGARTWQRDLPYLLGSLSIATDALLTIEPGVVTKFEANNAILYVNGTLHANGTEADPVTFTHISDDAAGGDTNGDLSGTSPSSGSWDSIRFLAGSHGTLSHTTVRYGGYFTSSGGVLVSGGQADVFDSVFSNNTRGISVTSGMLTVDRSDFGSNSDGILVNGGTTSVHQSSLHDNVGYGVRNTTTTAVDATSNWWGDATGPLHTTTNPGGLGDRVSNFVLHGPWLGYDPLTTTVPTVTIDSGPTDPSEEETVTFEFSSNVLGVTFYCVLTAPNSASPFEPCTSPAAYAVTENGAHIFAVYAEDGDGLVSDTVEWNWTAEVSNAYKVAVILTDFIGTEFDDSPQSFTCYAGDVAQTFDGQDSAYYQALFDCAANYHLENSYESFDLDVTVYDGVDGSYELGWPELRYDDLAGTIITAQHKALVNDSINKATEEGAVLDADLYVVVFAGSSATLNDSAVWDSSRDRRSVVVSKDVGLGTVVHELGHHARMVGGFHGVLPDLYEGGKSGWSSNVGDWDAMATGYLRPSFVDQSRPVHMSTPSKYFAGILALATPGEDYGPVDVTSLVDLEFGAEVPTFAVGEETPEGNRAFYVLEGRTTNAGRSTWDQHLPEGGDAYLVGYFVDGEKRIVSIPGNSKTPISQSLLLGTVDRAILEPGSDDVYMDYANGIRLTASTATDVSDLSQPYVVTANIAKLSDGEFAAYVGQQMSAAFLDVYGLRETLSVVVEEDTGNQVNLESSVFPEAGDVTPVWPEIFRILATLSALIAAGITWSGFRFKQHRRLLLILGVAAGVGAVCFAYLSVTTLYPPNHPGAWSDNGTTYIGRGYEGLQEPDIDLHVYCDDGRHIGVNYDTGEYEVGIVGAITNGDGVGFTEWILFPPAGNEGCRHVVSAHDNEMFLAANPDIAAQLPSTDDAYDIYARYIDPASGIFTSEVLANQTIAPGETVVHEVSGTTDVTVGVGVVDETAPVTTASFDGMLGADGETYVGDVTVTLASSDGSGTGVAEITYSADDGLTWATYTAPFVLSADGLHELYFGATDFLGNFEATQSATVTIDSTGPVIALDSAPTDPAYSTDTTFAFSSDDAAASYECVLDGAVPGPCVSPEAYTALVLGSHSFEVVATDAAGNASQPFTYTWTIVDSGTVEVTFLRHTVQSGNQPGSTKEGIEGAIVNVYSKAPGSCADAIGYNPHDYHLILDGCTPEHAATTDSAGFASLTVAVPDEYVLISEDPQTNVIAGVSSGLVDGSVVVDKHLQVIVRANGSAVPGKTTKKVGSLLYIIEPEYVTWDATQELYPFIFDAPDGEWGITVTVEPPEGFTADHESLTTTVDSGDYNALQFMITDIGSCWECGTGVDIEIRHNGNTEHLRRAIPTPMTERFIRQKGKTVEEMHARSVRVEPGSGHANERAKERVNVREGGSHPPSLREL